MKKSDLRNNYFIFIFCKYCYKNYVLFVMTILFYRNARGPQKLLWNDVPAV